MGEVLVPVLARLVQRQDLTDDEVVSAARHILGGEASEVEIAGFIVALRTKGETTSELAAIVRTMLEFSVPVVAEPTAIDTCGTGGDRSGTVNISTIGAIIAAGAGAKVAKHGNRAASSQCGSADVLEALGIPIELGPLGVARCVAEAGIGFCFAPRFHPALRFLGPVRRALGVPTTFNFLGPLANPARVTRQCVGVSDARMAERVLEVLIANGAIRAMVFCGDDGLDELTTTTTSQVFELRDGSVSSYQFDPSTVGLARASHAALMGGDAAHNAAAVHAVLNGEMGAVRDIAVVNAAAALQVADLAQSWESGIALAERAVDSGAARDTLERWRTVALDAVGEDV